MLMTAGATLAEDLSLWYAQPARSWLEALPIGKSVLGGMFFGGTTNERVQFNEQTRWLGSETAMGSYQPFGDMFIAWTHGVPTEYRRELDLSDAIQCVSYHDGDVNFRREAFASFPDQVMVLRFTADQSGKYSGEIRLMDMHSARITADGKSAIRWVREHTVELCVDPARIVAAGASAGGQVAAAAGIVPRLDQSGED